MFGRTRPTRLYILQNTQIQFDLCRWSDGRDWKFELWKEISTGDNPEKDDCVKFFREGL